MAGLRGSEAHCGRFWWILSNNLRGFLLNKSVKSNMISSNHYIGMVVFVISNQKMTFICLPKQDSISYKEKMAHSFWQKWHFLAIVGCKRASRWGRCGAGSCASLKFHLFFPVSNAVQARVPYPMLEVRPNQQRPQRAIFTFQPQISINLNPKFTF